MMRILLREYEKITESRVRGDKGGVETRTDSIRGDHHILSYQQQRSTRPASRSIMSNVVWCAIKLTSMVTSGCCCI
jgi:hypothetical protein